MKDYQGHHCVRCMAAMEPPFHSVICGAVTRRNIPVHDVLVCVECWDVSEDDPARFLDEGWEMIEPES